MARDICPKCNALRELRSTVSERTVFLRDGRRKRIRTRLYHCAACHAFVRSEEEEDPKEQAGRTGT